MLSNRKHTFNKACLHLAVLAICFNPVTSAADIFDELDDAAADADGYESFESGPSQDSYQSAEPSTSGPSSLEDEFQAWKAAEDAEFNAWKEQYFAELNAFKEKILNVWEEAELTDNTSWVEYSEDLSTKKVVDYENNEIRVSIAGGSEELSEEEIQKYIEDILKTTPNDARKNDPVLKAVGESAPSQDRASNQSMLAELTEAPIILPEPKPRPEAKTPPKATPKTAAEKAPIAKEELSRERSRQPEQASPAEPKTPATPPVAEKKQLEREARAIARQQAEEKKAPVKPAPKPTLAAVAKQLSENAVVEQTGSANSKPVTTITIKLPNDATYKRSKTYAKEVTQRAKENKLDPSLVYAVMHTESAFNPMARSPIPAFGLMQIVPGSAGKDVTQQWYGKAKLLQPKELFNAQTNIHAGTTYLNILYYRYLKGVTNPESRKYCVIAAYNTGAGNVSEAFIGSKRIRDAFPVINKLTPEQVYQTLVTQLPYDETRHYLQRVTKRQAVYQQL